MTRDAVEKVPDSKWHDGPEKWFFSQTAYHTVETIIFYIGSNPDDMNWGGRAGYSWYEGIDIRKDIVPKITKDLVLSYIQEVEKELKSLFAGMSEETLLNKDGFHWFACVLEKLQYALRHTAHHCGELSLALRQWGEPHNRWK
jgi:hypothetical protein